MSNEKKIAQIKKLIDEVHANTTVPMSQTKEDLLDIASHVDMIVDAIQCPDPDEDDE